jgi:hypothetical protein
MKVLAGLSLCVLLLFAGCGGAKVTARVDELQAKNEELTRRVKALEDDLFTANKTIVQHDQALRQMADRLRSMENSVNKIELGPR